MFILRRDDRHTTDSATTAIIIHCMHCLADCLLATVIRVFFPTLSVSRLVCYKVTVYYTDYMHSTYVFSETLAILTEKNMRV